jgi:hypothetical protein
LVAEREGTDEERDQGMYHESPRNNEVEIGNQRYDSVWIVALCCVVGLGGQVLKKFNLLSEFITNIVDWFSADGLCIVIYFAVIRPTYNWLTEKNYIDTSRFILIGISILLAFYVLLLAVFSPGKE